MGTLNILIHIDYAYHNSKDSVDLDLKAKVTKNFEYETLNKLYK